jgi:hypothetical protein
MICGKAALAVETILYQRPKVLTGRARFPSSRGGPRPPWRSRRNERSHVLLLDCFASLAMTGTVRSLGRRYYQCAGLAAGLALAPPPQVKSSPVNISCHGPVRPGLHKKLNLVSWMAGSSPAMTTARAADVFARSFAGKAPRRFPNPRRRRCRRAARPGVRRNRPGARWSLWWRGLRGRDAPAPPPPWDRFS